MQELMTVEFTDGTCCQMIPAALNLFLREKNWVRRFQRSTGWVRVGHDLLRGEGRVPSFSGADRRLVA